MEEKVNFVMVGVFVLALSAALIGGVLWLSSSKSYRASYDIYQTYMPDSVAGLNLDAPVRYRGVEVGRVQKITLAPGNVEQVQLTLAIERGVPVKVDTVAILQVQGLTGIAYVELTGGGRDSPPLQKQANDSYPVIKSGPSLMTRLDSAVTVLLTNLNRTSENLNAVLDEDNRRAVKSTLADLAVLSRTLAARSGTIDASLAAAAHTLKNVSRLSDELPQLIQRVQRSADAFDRMSNELAHAGARAGSTLDSAQQFSASTLPEVHQLVLELRDLTVSLRHVSDQLEQDPSVLLRGKPQAKPGPGE
ncbi:MAG: MCE family protein [Nitrosomonadales bacterium]|nr:MCE family protein [Nitrosomonadales bacterium]